MARKKSTTEPRYATFTDVRKRGGPRPTFTVPPWIDVSIDLGFGLVGVARWELEDTETPLVPNSANPDGPLFPNRVGADLPMRESDRDFALDYIALSLAQHLHELLEWVTVDGKKLAIAHPEDDMWDELIPDRDADDNSDPYGYWNWSTEKMRSVVNAYCRRYPVSKRAEDD